MTRSAPPHHVALVALLAASQAFFGLPLVGGAPQRALAQAPQPRVWLGPMTADDVPGARLLSQKFDEATRDQLRRSQKVQTTDQKESGPVKAGESDERVERPERLRVAGKEAYAANDLQKALDQLRGALDLYEEGLASVNKLEAIAETLGFLGATTLALGFDADAEDYFRRVVALLPEAEPLDEFSEDAKAMFGKERKKLLKKKKGSLVISTEPEGAEVRVDGIERGKAPVTVKDLVRGDHYVQASDATAGLAAQRTRVKGGKPRKVNLTLSMQVGPEPAQKADPTLVTQLTEQARKMDINEAFREKAEAIASQTRADCVVVGFVTPQGNDFALTAFVYSVAAKQTARLDELRFRANLSAVTSKASGFAGDVETACTAFPFDKVVAGPLVLAAAPVAPPPTEHPDLAKHDPLVAVPPPDEPFETFKPTSLEDPNEQGPGDDDDSSTVTWVLLTVAGAALVGGAVVGGYYLLQDEPKSGYDATVVW